MVFCYLVAGTAYVWPIISVLGGMGTVSGYSIVFQTYKFNSKMLKLCVQFLCDYFIFQTFLIAYVFCLL